MKRIIFSAILALSSTIVHADDDALFNEAITSGNVAQVKAMLAKNVNINATDEYGYTPLHHAMRIDIVALLLAKGANVNAKGGALKGTPLHGAIEDAEKGVVELMLENGSDINATRTDGQTPLTLAVESRKKDVVELLLAKHANINAANNWDFTALHIAVYKNLPDIATLLFNEGANINAQQEKGPTPLHVAVKESRIDMIKLLIAHGAETSITNKKGDTPLDDAISSQKTEIAELLLEKGAPVNAIDKDGRTPLYLVAQYGNEHLADLLLAKGANVNAARWDGRTPIFGAAASNNRAVADWLLSKGAQLDIKDTHANTPLHVAAQFNNSSEVPSWLLDHKVDINARNDKGNTALHLAADTDRLAVAELLLKKGANTSIKNNDGMTPLMLAQYSRSKQVSKLLGAQPAVAVAPVTKAKVALNESEFESCARKAVLFDRSYNTFNKLVERHQAGDRTYSEAELQAKFDEVMRQETSGPDCTNGLNPSHAAKYCSQSRYESVWCSRLMQAPEVKKYLGQ